MTFKINEPIVFTAPFSNPKNKNLTFEHGVRFEKSTFDAMIFEKNNTIKIAIIVELKDHQDIQNNFETQLAEIIVAGHFTKINYDGKYFFNLYHYDDNHPKGGHDITIKGEIFTCTPNTPGRPHIEIIFTHPPDLKILPIDPP